MDFNAALEVKRRVEGPVHELLDVLSIHVAPSRTSISEASRSLGWAAVRASTLTAKAESCSAARWAWRSFRRTLPERYSSATRIRPLALRHRAGQAENHAPQLVSQFLAGFAGELFHVGHVHAGFFRNGDRQGLGGGVHGGDGLMWLISGWYYLLVQIQPSLSSTSRAQSRCINLGQRLFARSLISPYLGKNRHSGGSVRERPDVGI